MLDEPTIGLHPRDNQILLNALRKLGDRGNTLVVVEHDEDTIRRADHDHRYWSRRRQARRHADRAGRCAPICPAQPESLTGQFLRLALSCIRCSRAAQSSRRAARAAAVPENWLTVHGGKLHNLRNVTVHIRCRGSSR